MKIHTQYGKRLLALLLAFAMMVSIPVSALAAKEAGRVVPAEKVESEKLLNHMASVQTDLELEQTYAPDDLVTVIVEMEDASVLEQYAQQSSTMTVQEFHLTEATRVQELLAAQQKVIHTLKDATVVYQYTTVMNGFAAKIPYSKLEQLRQTAGVKRAFVSGKNRLVEPVMDSATDMTGASFVWENLGYTGAGTTIAIIDTGLATGHEAFQTAPKDGEITVKQLQWLLNRYAFASEDMVSDLAAQKLYINGKVPYAFDYADGDCDVAPQSDATNESISHGTHVSGIAGGYKANSEGVVTFSGVAPDAQILAMKVFSDYYSGAYDENIFAALEDAVLLDADVINMSLGTDCGFSVERDETTQAIYQRIKDAGISLICSAGNSTDSAAYNNTGYDLNPAADIDTGVVGSPSTYSGALSVASADNAVAFSLAMMAGSEYLVYTTTALTMKSLIPEDADSITMDYVMVGGTGNAEDYAAAGDLTGKIAVVQRGVLSFTEKVQNGAAAGAAAVIVYDNVEGNLINMASDGNTIPAAFVSLADGEFLAAQEAKQVTILASDQPLPNATAGQISAFSSKGTTPDLKLKPEITAPGGSIFSTLPGTDAYGNMSGTSMASPHMAGAASLVRQYIAHTFGWMTNKQVQELTNQLLMSTAVPLVEEAAETFYSPRMQGAGLANLKAALTAEAYLSVADADGSRPVLNLGDDMDRLGQYTLTFQITNLSDIDKTYSMNIAAQAPAAAFDGKAYYLTASDVALDASKTAAETITVPADSTVEVSETITLSENDKAYLDECFQNGAYVEGFVQLIPENTEEPTLGLPFLAFYGDWTDAPVLDSVAWYEESETNRPLMYSHVGASSIVQYGQVNLTYLGANMFLSEAQTTYNPDRFTISPNDDGYYDSVTAALNGQLRSATTVHYEITTENGDVVYTFDSYDNPKTTNGPSGYMVAGAYSDWGMEPYFGTDAEGNPLPDGTKLNVSITAELEYDGRTTDAAENNWSFPVVIDTVAPELKNMSTRIAQRDGRYYLQGTAVDTNAVMHINVVGVMVFGSYLYPDYSSQVSAPTDGAEAAFEVDITSIVNSGSYPMVYLFLDDYGYNESVYAVPLTLEEGLVMSAEVVLLELGEESYLSVLNNTDAEDVGVVWASDNEASVTVNDNGMLTAVSPGQAMITATTSNGEKAACLVGVREPNPITDFTLCTEEITTTVGTAGYLSFIDHTPDTAILDEYEVVWTSSDPEVLEIQNIKYFIGRKEGTATLTASLNGIERSATVHVVSPYDENGQYMYLGYPDWSGAPVAYPTIQGDGWIPSMSHTFQVFYKDETGANITPEDAVYTWTTSDPEVVSISSTDEGAVVNEDGSITANSIQGFYVCTGFATVTATDANGRSASFSVYVRPNKPSDTVLYTETSQVDYTIVSMSKGEDLKLEPFVYYNSSASLEKDRQLLWKSFDESVAVVNFDSDGNPYISGLKAGYAVISATMTSGSDTYFGVVVAEPEPLPFTDVKQDAWYVPYVRYVVEKGYMEGVGEGLFGPDMTLTRGMLVTTLYRMAGEPAVEGMENPFTDLKQDWYVDAVTWAANAGIVNGITETLFAPESDVTREQAATMLYRYAGQPETEGADLSSFPDGSEISAYAVPAMSWAVEEGFFAGFEDGTLRARAYLSRAQMAKLLTILDKKS